MTVVDVLVLVWIVVSAAFGGRRGLLVQLFSLVGLVAGAFVGSRLGPSVLSGGEASPWLPLAGLIGGLVGAVLFETGAHAVRRRFVVGPLDVVDTAGGIVLGTLFGLAVAWLFGALALQQPALGLRRDVQHSTLLRVLVDAVPPANVLRALNRVDPLPFIPAFPDRALPPPDPSVLRDADVRAAAQSVVKIEGTSCGVGVQGSGWVVRPDLVATNAHVIAGESDTRVLALNGQDVAATAVYVNAKNDVALLRVRGLRLPPIPFSSSFRRGSVVLLGYPANGPLTAVPGTAGRPTNVLTRDAYGRGPVLRPVLPLRGRVQRGDSGGAAVDGDGALVGMMFAATRNRRGGFAVPPDAVRRGLEAQLRRVATGPCVG